MGWLCEHVTTLVVEVTLTAKATPAATKINCREPSDTSSADGTGMRRFESRLLVVSTSPLYKRRCTCRTSPSKSDHLIAMAHRTLIGPNSTNRRLQKPDAEYENTTLILIPAAETQAD